MSNVSTMNAHNRRLPEWFDRIRSRQVTLPRFQRFVAWDHGQVSGLLTTVLRQLPSGATLVLRVDTEELFKGRTMVGAPESDGRVLEQLLDGQQRLTALWCSMHDKYPDRTYLARFRADPENEEEQVPYAYGQARWTKNGTRYPVWVDNPKECRKRGYIPIRLLRPEDIQAEIDEWAEMSEPDDVDDRFKAFKEISGIITGLRTCVRDFNLPYLELSAETTKEVALDVFVKMNTSSVNLSTYDIVVALVEEETEKSLHDHVETLRDAVPRATDYTDLPRLVLDVVALDQDRVPSQARYRGLNYTEMVEEWPLLINGISGMVDFLEEEGIFDGQRLPSYTALPVIAALWRHLPIQPDQLGNARYMLKKYLWRSFLTDRYEQSSASNALQDFRGLRNTIQNGVCDQHIPIFNSDNYPFPDKDSILRAEWPKGKTILGRGLLALQINCGAVDPADGKPASLATIGSKEHPREYHHLFPISILEDAGVPRESAYLALNCALITWRTNRTISNKDPVTYLRERSVSSSLGEDELRRRLKTHLIPYNKLAVGYDTLTDEERRPRVTCDYQKFVGARAEILATAADHACQGLQLDPNELVKVHQE